MTSNRRKSYYLVAGLCVTALIVDRFVMPQASDGAVPDYPIDEDLPGDDGPTDSAGKGQDAIPELDFPFVVKMFDAGYARDPFAPPSSVFPPVEKPASQSEKAKQRDGQKEGKLTASELQAAYRLEAVVSFGTTQGVKINGRWIPQGATFHGCVLVDVFGRTAVFECADETVNLVFDKRPGRGL